MIFGTFCLCGLIHVFLVFQETCGKTLEEMGDIFDNESIWAFKVKSRESRLVQDIEHAKKVIEMSEQGTKCDDQTNIETV
jgi:hypothetical protein